ncbi:MAG TPA: hypothetical protein V6C93_30805, partial [Allocoleopsis sp.]
MSQNAVLVANNLSQLSPCLQARAIMFASRNRYYAVRTEPQAYSTQAIQELRIQQLEQEIAVLKQRNADLTACLDEAV